MLMKIGVDEVLYYSKTENRNLMTSIRTAFFLKGVGGG